MEAVGAWFIVAVIGIPIALGSAVLTAIPTMWLFGFLHYNGAPAVPALGYGASWVVAALVTYVAAMIRAT